MSPRKQSKSFLKIAYDRLRQGIKPQLKLSLLVLINDKLTVDSTDLELPADIWLAVEHSLKKELR